jgi:hypothetical protein
MSIWVVLCLASKYSSGLSVGCALIVDLAVIIAKTLPKHHSSRLPPDSYTIGTFKSASVAVESDYFVAANISFENSAYFPSTAYKYRQVVALRISGDMATFFSCGFFLVTRIPSSTTRAAIIFTDAPLRAPWITSWEMANLYTSAVPYVH